MPEGSEPGRRTAVPAAPRARAPGYALRGTPGRAAARPAARAPRRGSALTCGRERR